MKIKLNGLSIISAVFAIILHHVPVQAEELTSVEPVSADTQTVSNKDKIHLSTIQHDLSNHEAIFSKHAETLYSEDVIYGEGVKNHGDAPDDESPIGPTVKKLSKRIIDHHPEIVAKIKPLEQALRKSAESVYGDPKKSGVEYVVYTLINRWDSFQEGPLGKALQVAAMQKFNLHHANIKRFENDDITEFEPHLQTIGLILDAMKQLTYDTLKSKGVGQLTLYRGIRLSQQLQESNQVAIHHLSPLSSFTISKEMGEEFSTVFSDEKRNPYVLVKNVPIDRILSYAPTGLGTYSEAEFIVLGPDNPEDEFFILPGKRLNITHDELIRMQIERAKKMNQEFLARQLKEQAQKELKQEKFYTEVKPSRVKTNKAWYEQKVQKWVDHSDKLKPVKIAKEPAQKMSPNQVDIQEKDIQEKKDSPVRTEDKIKHKEQDKVSDNRQKYIQAGLIIFGALLALFMGIKYIYNRK